MTATIVARPYAFAILPILLYIGLVIGAQAFEATPPRHAPAVIPVFGWTSLKLASQPAHTAPDAARESA